MYKIFMMIFEGRRVYLSNPFPSSFAETLRTVGVYKKSNPNPYYFIENIETGEVIES